MLVPQLVQFTGGTATDLVITLNTNSTPAAVQALLNDIQYSSTSQNPTNYGAATSRALTISLNDGGNTGTGSNTTTTLTGTVAITAVDNPPVITGTAGGSYTEAGSALTLASVTSSY